MPPQSLGHVPVWTMSLGKTEKEKEGEQIVKCLLSSHMCCLSESVHGLSLTLFRILYIWVYFCLVFPIVSVTELPTQRYP